MRRTLTTPLAAVAVAAVVMMAAATIGDTAAAPQRLRARVTPVPDTATLAVPSPQGAILAEMTRRLGTPRRVALAARKRAREWAQFQARLAAIRAARRAEAARLAAERRAARAATIPSGPWSDPAAAAVANGGPVDRGEAQWLASGHGGWLESNGYARAPSGAPEAIRRVIQAGNLIARSPYVWGGGHGRWVDNGYDCSGSVGYALASGGLLGWSQTSGQLMSWGMDGPGRWLTIYASPTHVFMVVAGLRFDTSGRAGDHASRWQLAPRSTDGFAVRHFPGL